MTHPASAPSFETRRLAAAHAAGCRAIRLAALRDAPAVFGTTCDTQAGLRLAAFVQRLDGAIAFGAYVGGALAGMAGFKRPDGAKGRHRGVPWGMFVAPAARRPASARRCSTRRSRPRRGQPGRWRSPPSTAAVRRARSASGTASSRTASSRVRSTQRTAARTLCRW